MSILEYLLTDYWQQNGDPRVVDLPFMSSFTPLGCILSVYSLFVLLIGPLWMSTRKPFSLKPILVVYNLVMSLVNAYFLYKFLSLHQFGLYMFNVQLPSFDDHSPKALERISLQHLYLMSKIVDLLDTVFFVLRKKQTQVTGLHFYHHLTVPILGWTYIRLCGNSAIMLPFALMNSFIHTLMYAYYGLSVMGPSLQPYLWWKRYLTQIQIIQFALLLAYGLYFATFQQGYQPYYTQNLLAQSALYLVLFTRFYFNTYNSNNKKIILKKTASKAEIDVNNNFNINQNGHKLKTN